MSSDGPTHAAVASIELRNGRLHIPGDVHAEHLYACDAVGLLVRDGAWLLMPLRSGAGGLQVKLRNARGDRVVESQEFFRSLGLEDDAASSAVALFADVGEGMLRMVLAGR